MPPQKATTIHWERKQYSGERGEREDELYSRTESSEGHAVRLNRLRDVLINSGSWVWLPTTHRKAFPCSSYLLSLFFSSFLFLISWPPACQTDSDLWPLHCVSKSIWKWSSVCCTQCGEQSTWSDDCEVCSLLHHQKAVLWYTYFMLMIVLWSSFTSLCPFQMTKLQINGPTTCKYEVIEMFYYIWINMNLHISLI